MIKWLVKKVLKEEIKKLAEDFYKANKEEIVTAVVKKYCCSIIARELCYKLKYDDKAREELIYSLNKNNALVVALVKELNSCQLGNKQ